MLCRYAADSQVLFSPPQKKGSPQLTSHSLATLDRSRDQTRMKATVSAMGRTPPVAFSMKHMRVSNSSAEIGRRSKACMSSINLIFAGLGK